MLEEFNMRVANNPDARLTEQMMAALYLNHPYGRPVIGWRQEIEKLDREDALAFYKRFYAPNNAILIIAGDVDAEISARWWKRCLAGSPRSPRSQPSAAGRRSRCRRPPHRDAVRPPGRTDQRAALLSCALGHHRRGRRKPGARRARATDGHRLQLLSLSRAGDRPAARGRAGAGYQGTSLDPTQFLISVSPKPGVDSRRSNRRSTG